jgi:hypothetical protein
MVNARGTPANATTGEIEPVVSCTPPVTLATIESGVVVPKKDPKPVPVFSAGNTSKEKVSTVILPVKS